MVELKRGAVAALRTVVACILLASCHTPTITYKAPPSATPANSATIVGTTYSRNAFNSVYNCLDGVDGGVMGSGPFLCKHLARESLLVTPGQHSLTLAFQWESGQFTSGSSKAVSVDLAAGQTYTIRGEQLDDPDPGKKHKAAIWLQDSRGTVLGGRQELTFDDPEQTAERAYADKQKGLAALYGRDEDRIYPMNRSNPHPLDPLTLPPIHRLFVYADFGNQSQPFEKAFTDRLQAQMAGCGVGLKMMSVPHATKLTLDAPQKLPPDKEMLPLAAADGADYLLKIAVLEWAGPGLRSTDLSRPVDEGRFNIEMVLLSTSGGEVWHPSFSQPRVAKGGDAFADSLIQTLGRDHGALPGCRTEGK